MSKHVVVIGAGVIGLCTAYYCLQRGFTVTVVERLPAQRDGTSFGNAGMIVPSHFIPLAAPGMITTALKWMWNSSSPFYIKPRLSADLIDWCLKFSRAANIEHVRRSAPLLRDLSFASRSCFEQLTTSMDYELVKKGLLMLCQNERTLEDEARTATHAKELDIPAEILNEKQTAVLDPNTRMHIVGSVYYPLDCTLTPERFLAALQANLVNAGVQFIWCGEVVDFEIEKPRRIRATMLADGNQIEADELVLCSGAWSPLLAAKLSLRIPVEAGKGYSLTLPKPRQLPSICSILTEARVAVTPMGEALRVGGTMEIAGLSQKIKPNRVRGIVNSFCRYFPDFNPSDFDDIPPWRGLRPCSPDGLPYIGRTARFDNLSIATGHSMMGLSLGPITGKLMAEVLSDSRLSHDITMLSPDRYN